MPAPYVAFPHCPPASDGCATHALPSTLDQSPPVGVAPLSRKRPFENDTDRALANPVTVAAVHVTPSALARTAPPPCSVTATNDPSP